MSLAALQSQTLQDLLKVEAERFVAQHPRSIAMAGQAAQVWRGGVPMHWMGDWACPSPIFAMQGVGA
ncbi:MAG TPA: aspartate aminotransferase family protein, partial [Caulobacter sp.]|nr:aspartate aminotransferase family protein [Caulobacter sp.]